MDCRRCEFAKHHKATLGWDECTFTGGQVPAEDRSENFICPLALPVGRFANCGRAQAQVICAGTLRQVADRGMLGELLAAYSDEDATKLRGIALAEGIPLPG